jgi:hypothetical protein
MPHGVEQKDRQHHGGSFQLAQLRDQVDSGCDPEHKHAEQQIYGQNIHESHGHPPGFVTSRPATVTWHTP